MEGVTNTNIGEPQMSADIGLGDSDFEMEVLDFTTPAHAEKLKSSCVEQESDWNINKPGKKRKRKGRSTVSSKRPKLQRSAKRPVRSIEETPYLYYWNGEGPYKFAEWSPSGSRMRVRHVICILLLYTDHS